MEKQVRNDLVTISMSKKVKERGQKASKKMFGNVNLSGYISALIIKDCDEKNIK